MSSLFPDMDAEILSDRKAERREARQRAREYLAKRDIVWLINQLLDHGPASEHMLMLAAIEDQSNFHLKIVRGMDVLVDLIALWTVGKLWRKPMGIHPGSGDQSYLYGIRGVHSNKDAI